MIHFYSRFLAVAIVCTLCFGRQLTVPADYATIQDALDALSANDTVLVDSGVYVEELQAPDFSFVMMGNVGDDTTGASRPVVDPSGLTGPTARGCMVLQSGHVRISDFVFRNGAAMYPHMENDVGGISLGRANITLSNCLFDSVHYGVIGYAHNGFHNVRLLRCSFQNTSGRGIQAHTVFADSSSFHADSINWAQLTFSDGSRINACSFTGGLGSGNVLLCFGANVQVTNCSFVNIGFAQGYPALVLRIGASEVANNLFSDYEMGGPALAISERCEIGPNSIHGNVFQNLRTPPEHSNLAGYGMGISGDENSDCEPSVVYDNVFQDCEAGIGPSGLSFSGRCIVTHNRFVRLRSTSVASAVRIDEGDYTFRDNFFLGNDTAVAPDGINNTARVERNYWGHESGPYHPLLNPLGQGDAVADSVDFDPWHQDTLFWTSVENTSPAISSTWRLLTLYPNPLNNDFRMEIAGFTRDDFTVRLFNLLGREVALLHSGNLTGGTLHFTAPPTLSSGVYFVTASDHFHTETKKVVLLK